MDPGGVLTGGDQQLPGDVCADSVEGEQVGIDGSDQWLDELVEVGDLLGERGVPAGQAAQRDLGRLLGLVRAVGVRAQAGAGVE